MNKTLAKIKADPRVSDAFHDSDGYWVWLKAGWRSDPGEHGLHYDTVRDLQRRLRDIEPCACDECRRTINQGE